MSFVSRFLVTVSALALASAAHAQTFSDDASADAGGAVDEFVRLSGEAWPDFERQFETKIYGLFLAAESDADRTEGARRLLLMTRYRDLGEWQVSRDPTSDAMQVFLRRRELTRISLARACTVMPRG